MALGIGVLFLGTLAAVVLGAFIARRWNGTLDFLYVGLHAALMLLVGALGCLILGFRSWRKSLGSWPAARWLAIAPVAGAVAAALAMLYARMLASAGHGGAPSEAIMTPATVLLVVIVAPLLEEWIDRGVLWVACLRAGDERIALLVTSGLFAISHGLNGGYMLEIPHRFVGGLVLGWLRWRSGSLVTPIIAHVTWNVLAIWSASA